MAALRQTLRISLFLVLFFFPASLATAQSSVGTLHRSDLGVTGADGLPNGDVVISLAATGELRGLITLILHPSNGGYTGEWAFTVAHADTTDPATGLDPELEDAEHHEDSGADPEATPHKGFLQIIQRGTLQGAVSGASFAVDANGVLTDLSASLSIDRGGKEFDGATGSGAATLSGLVLIF